MASTSTTSAAPHLTLTHDFSSIRLGGPGGCIDSTESLAERQRRSPHDQAATAGFELTTSRLRNWRSNQLRYLAVNY